MRDSIYFHIFFLFLWPDFGLPKAIQEDIPEDHLQRPDLDYSGYEDVTFSYNNYNDHVTLFNFDLDLDAEHKKLSDMDLLHLDDQLTTETELFEDIESYNEQTTSRILNVLRRPFSKIMQNPETDLYYEIEDRIVRYAMNNRREEI